jgi:hypothetical protein
MNTEERKSQPLEAVTKRQVKTLTENISVMIFVAKCPISPINNPKPVYSHTPTSDNIVPILYSLFFNTSEYFKLLLSLCCRLLFTSVSGNNLTCSYSGLILKLQFVHAVDWTWWIAYLILCLQSKTQDIKMDTYITTAAEFKLEILVNWWCKTICAYITQDDGSFFFKYKINFPKFYLKATNSHTL